MKKLTISFLLAISLLGANFIKAQEGGYFNVNLGYGFPMGASNLIEFYNVTTTSSNVTTTEQINLSLGKGLNLGAAFGYMFNDNVGAELGLSYLLGGKTTAKNQNSGSTTERTLSSKMLRINPSLVISSGADGFNPYAKFGLVIGAGSIKDEEKTSGGGESSTKIWKYNGGIALGFSAALGASFELSDKMSFFGELNMINMSYAPTRGELIESKAGGVDLLPLLTSNEKKIDYVDSIVSNQTSSTTKNEELKQKMPFGSFGVNVGLRINL